MPDRTGTGQHDDTSYRLRKNTAQARYPPKSPKKDAWLSQQLVLIARGTNSCVWRHAGITRGPQVTRNPQERRARDLVHRHTFTLTEVQDIKTY